MVKTNVMDSATSAGAGIAITSPLWIIQIANPYIQFIVAVMGGVWLGVQIYYKIKNKGK
jgi:hypothetical protein